MMKEMLVTMRFIGLNPKMNQRERLNKQIAAHTYNKKRAFSIEGFEIVVYPQVYPPGLGSSKIFSSYLKGLNKKFNRILEIGCGSGILLLHLAQNAKEMVGTDINPYALKSARENIKINKIKNVKIIKSDLFNKIKGKFDLIIFNPPFLSIRPKNFLESAFTDEKHYTLKRFFKDVKNHLERDGRILLEFSNMGGEKTLNQLIKKHKLKKKVIYKTRIKDLAGIPTTFYILEIKSQKSL